MLADLGAWDLPPRKARADYHARQRVAEVCEGVILSWGGEHVAVLVFAAPVVGFAEEEVNVALPYPLADSLVLRTRVEEVRVDDIPRRAVVEAAWTVFDGAAI